jgi:hypothetical protein
LLAAGQRAAGLLAPLAQDREQLEHALLVGRDPVRIAAGERPHLEVLGHGQAREDLPPLRRLDQPERDDLVRRQPADIAPAEPDRAGARANAARDGHERGGLAGPVGADQGHDLALGHRDADAVQRLDVAVAGAQILELQHQPICSWPRYASITFGWLRISSGAPSAIFWP